MTYWEIQCDLGEWRLSMLEDLAVQEGKTVRDVVQAAIEERLANELVMDAA